VSVRGKTVVITGATAGIGEAAALELARRGADLVLVARNPDKAKATAAAIEQAAPNASVQTVQCDLASMRSVREAAAELIDRIPRIDVLINNAGLAAVRDRTTDEAHDEMLAANYFGPFLLTHLVLSNVGVSAPARIVVVGSEAHRVTGRLDVERFEHMGSYSGLTAQLAYGRTKLLDILFADELARRLRSSEVTVNSLCPGLVATGLVREVGGPIERAGAFISERSPFMRTPAQGARMTVHLADSDKVDGVTGRFFTSTPGFNVLPTVRARRDPRIARRVYERTCELVEVEPVKQT
jgi:retinol dehydrogenase-12